MDELMEAFSVDRIHKAGAIFDVEKLDWMNWQWRRRLFFEDVQKHARTLDENVRVEEPKPQHYVYHFASPAQQEDFFKYRGEKLAEMCRELVPADFFADEAFFRRACLSIEEKILQDPASAREHLGFYFKTEVTGPRELLLNEKMKVLKYLIDKNITQVDDVGKIFSSYYSDRENLIKSIGG